MYSINIAHKGEHLFTTNHEQLTSDIKAAELVSAFVTKFPPAKGYAISVTYHPTICYSSTDIKTTNVDEIIKIISDLWDAAHE